MKRLFTLIGVLLLATAAEAQSTRYVTVTPTITGGAYTANQVVGGLMTFTNVACASTSKGVVSGVIVTDKADQSVEYNVLIFKQQPAGTFTNAATVDPNDSDLPYLLPVINLTTSDHFSFNDNGVSSLSSLSSVAISAESNEKLYVALVTKGTPTYASTSDISVTLAITCN